MTGETDTILTRWVIPIPPLIRGMEDPSLARSIAEKYQIWHLPLVDRQTFRFLGMLPLSTFLRFSGKPDPSSVQPLRIPLLPEVPPLHEMVRLFLRWEVSALPISRPSTQQYEGMIPIWKVLQRLQQELGYDEATTFLWVEFSPVDYSLSDLIRLLESEGASIKLIKVMPGSRVHLRKVWIALEGIPLQRITGALEHVGIRVLEASDTEELESMYRERYEALMKYLDI